MRITALRAALLSAMLAFPLASLAQYSQQQGSTGGDSAQRGLEGAQSKHCDTMSGAEKDQCLKDEAAKTDSKGPSDSGASGGSAPSSTSGSSDTTQTPATPEKATTK